MGDDPLARLTRRYEREVKARQQAEAIAEKVTSDLYASGLELERLNKDLEGANDELRSLNQEMRDFVAIASHDLRGPLTTIIGFASTLAKRWGNFEDDRKQEFIGLIHENARHLTRMVEDLLTVSRIESGALETRAKVIEFREAIEVVMRDFQDRAAEVQVVYPPDLALFADADHLQRILTNYLSNALKYGSSPIVVEAAELAEWIEIRVRDVGDGVAEDFIPRLFGKFSRAEDKKTRSHQGTGLGLSIVRGLARANGGDTWYEPNVPKGSCFAVRLPKTAAALTG
jgi:signal transduction histidine kinase